MANSLLTIDMVTREASRLLENELVVTRNVDRQYDNAFAKSGAKIGDTLRVRLPDRMLVSDGATLVVQPELEQWTTLTCSSQKHIGIAFSQAERTMKLDDYSNRILKPRLSQLAATIDADVAQGVVKYIGNVVGTPGTTPSSSAVLLAAMQRLDETAAPRSERYLTLNPAANAAMVEGMKGYFNPSGIISDQFKTGMIGKNVLGYDEIAMSQSIGYFTTGSRVAGTVATTTAAQGQETIVITISGGTASDTIKQGDVFTVANVYAVNPQTRVSTGSLYQFVARADATASGSALTVSVAPIYWGSTQALATVDSVPTATTGVVVFVGAASTSYPQNLFYHKNAIAFVTADLVLPGAGVESSRAVYNGISMTVTKGFDIVNYREICRLDVLYGYGVLRPELAGRLVG